MKNIIFCKVLLGLALIASYKCSSASENSSLFDLPLSELLKVKVVSKTEETINLSPGIVSVYYPEQLKLMGMHSMAEFLRFATSVEFNSAVGGIHPIQIRGLSDANNQKILFLIDRIPYWMPSHGEIPVNGVPMVAIEKIEVIRGPASVVHGTNSSSGVINVVTKSNAESLLSSYFHSEGIVRAGLYHSLELLDGQVDFSIESRSDKGYLASTVNTLAAFDPGCLCFPLAAEEDINRSSEYASILARYSSNTLDIGFQKYQEDLTAVASGTLLSPAIYKQFGTLINLNYQLVAGPTKTNFYSDWNQYYWRRDIQGVLAFNGIPGDGDQGFDNDGRANYRWRTGVTVAYSATDNSSWLFGIENETRSTENNKFRDQENGAVLTLITQPPFNFPLQLQPDGSILLIDTGKVDEQALLTQFDYTADEWRLVAGLRYVDNEFSGDHLSPRLSYIYKLSETDSIKFLFSEGFNSPTFRQITARNSLGVPQNVDVEAEIIETIELAYTIGKNDINQNFILFNTRAKDLIQSSFAGITNSDSIVERSGAEYEFQLQRSDFNLFANITYLSQGNRIIANDPTAEFSSKWLLKLGGSYRWNNNQAGFSLKSASKRANVDAYYQFDVSYQHQVDQWTFYTSIKNLFNEDLLFPDVRLQESVVFQGEPERNIALGFDYQF